MCYLSIDVNFEDVDSVIITNRVLFPKFNYVGLCLLPMMLLLFAWGIGFMSIMFMHDFSLHFHPIYELILI